MAENVRVRLDLNKLKRGTLLDAERAVKRSAAIVRNNVVIKLSRTQPTRITASGDKVGLDPSRPGEPPKQVSSRLKNSVTTGFRRIGNAAIGLVGTDVAYAARLEFGKRTGTAAEKAARPAFRPALKESESRIRAEFEEQGRS